MTTTLACRNRKRRVAVRQSITLAGFDYVDVGEDQVTLRVHFLGRLPCELKKENFRIEGGRRVRDIRVVDVFVKQFEEPELDDYVDLVLDRFGDYSTYTLRAVARVEERWVPHPEFDPAYNTLDFSFKADCPTELDCPRPAPCPPPARQRPSINYLVKDYASFRQAILDRLAVVMPDWTNRFVPDIGVTLVELLAYAGDSLSYYQDAVATEAYLDTARQRISVRRHARLVDYAVHEGCNARAFLALRVSGDLLIEPAKVQFITPAAKNVPTEIRSDAMSALDVGPFETFEAVAATQVYVGHDTIAIYTWGDSECCLPRGATAATLTDAWLDGDQGPNGGSKPKGYEPKPKSYESDAPHPNPLPASGARGHQSAPSPPSGGEGRHPNAPSPRVGGPDWGEGYGSKAENRPRRLKLQAGDFLIFEEILGPKTGAPADRDPTHRWVVRLTRVTADVDPLTGTPVLHIEWAKADALPFPLCISSIGPAPTCALLADVSVARGNIVLVDHGRTIEEGLPEVEVEATNPACECEGVAGEQTRRPKPFRPRLATSGVAFRDEPPRDAPATSVQTQDPHRAAAIVTLSDGRWIAVRDLLASRPTDKHFVVEMDNERAASLRFGNGTHGAPPPPAVSFRARYRVGRAAAGNVGADTITHAVWPSNVSGQIESVRNPLAARGGIEPQPIRDVKLFAPQTFRQRLERAVTAEDYAAIAQREFPGEVQRATAALRWNGSWYEALVAIDAFGADRASPELLARVRRRLRSYRRIGHDLRVDAATRVPVQIALSICIKGTYLRAHVLADLQSAFSDELRADGQAGGQPGFFHPDRLTFGGALYLSQVISTAQSVPGVMSVRATTFERMFDGPHGEIDRGYIAFGMFEIAQCDSDPTFPEHGRIEFSIGGGR